MNFLEEATARGFIHQTTDMEALVKAMQSPIRAYVGFDCTADSLHVAADAGCGAVARLRLT